MITGKIETPAGSVPVVTHEISRADTLGSIKARLGIGRMKYTVEPGLFAIGSPCSASPAFVTANYKLSFDTLRMNLEGVSAWILVLDTRGINVWCAAGKGTFGTEELERRLAATRLDEIVTHGMLIVPQLGAVGVNAREIKRNTGFTVRFGPVLARDIKRYLDAGCQKTPDMREMQFPVAERLKLVFVELNQAAKKLVPKFFAATAIVAMLSAKRNLAGAIARDLVPLLLSTLGGTVLMPALLPALPTRSFAIKGACAGLMTWLAAAALFPFRAAEGVAHLVAGVSLSAFLGLNFTGSTTFTSQSATEIEIKKYLKPMLWAFAAACAALVAIRFAEGSEE